MRLLAGAIDLAKNISPADIDLLAPTTQLVVRADIHAALIDLLLIIAADVHHQGGASRVLCSLRNDSGH